MLSYTRGQAVRMAVALVAIVVAVLVSMAIVVTSAPPISHAQQPPQGHNSGGCSSCHEFTSPAGTLAPAPTSDSPRDV